MPELPEVETLRRQLAGVAVGARIRSAEARHPRSVRRHPGPGPFASAVAGRQIVAVNRRAKYLLVELDAGRTLVVHLRMSGQLAWVPPPHPVAAHTHVVLSLDTSDGARQLRFVDPRTFGELFVVDTAALGQVASLARLGPDPLLDPLDPAALGRALAGRRGGLKALLVGQAAVAGLGNIYADEILHRAGLAPDRPAGSLEPHDVVSLAGALGVVLAEAIDAGGSTLGDGQYVDLWGAPGRYQASHRVYGRAGLACGRCGHTVVRTRVAGRSTHHCPGCQRGAGIGWRAVSRARVTSPRQR